MAKRVKPSISLIPISGWEEADEMVRRIGDRRIDIAKAQACAKARVDNIKEVLANTTAPLAEECDLLARSLEAFCAHHPEGFGDKRSREMAYGKVGWRKSTKLKIKSVAQTLEKIVEFFGPKKAQQYIRTKQEPDKEALAKLDDMQLKQVGCVRDVGDEFFVEPAMPASVSYQ